MHICKCTVIVEDAGIEHAASTFVISADKRDIMAGDISLTDFSSSLNNDPAVWTLLIKWNGQTKWWVLCFQVQLLYTKSEIPKNSCSKKKGKETELITSRDVYRRPAPSQEREVFLKVQ